MIHCHSDRNRWWIRIKKTEKEAKKNHGSFHFINHFLQIIMKSLHSFSSISLLIYFLYSLYRIRKPTSLDLLWSIGLEYGQVQSEEISQDSRRIRCSYAGPSWSQAFPRSSVHTRHCLLQRLDDLEVPHVRYRKWISYCCHFEVFPPLLTSLCLLSDHCSNSGSMRPGYRRGDLYLLSNRTDPLEVGNIVVYNTKGRNIPIVHRIHAIHETYLPSNCAHECRIDNQYYILTKGDNNTVHDVGLYAEGMSIKMAHSSPSRSILAQS